MRKTRLKVADRFCLIKQVLCNFSVVFDQHGLSKGYGFVRFGNEQEQQTALATMMNAVGLGGKPVKVTTSLAKRSMSLLKRDLLIIEATLSSVIERYFCR